MSRDWLRGREDSFHGKTFIVTGSSGFVGKNLAAELRLLGSRVIGLGLESLDFHIDQITELALSANAVFHVGANSDTLEKDSSKLFEQNFISTKNWAIACSRNQTPFVFSSSAANYGSQGSRPTNLYGWSKYVAEEYAIALGGLALRYFNVYGPGEAHKGKMSSFALQALEKSRRQTKIKIFPGGPKRDFVHVRDVVCANLMAFGKFEECRGNYYDVGTAQAITFEEVLTVLELDFEYLLDTDIPDGYQFYTQASRSRFLPGWEPSVQPHDGFRSYKRALEEIGLTS